MKLHYKGTYDLNPDSLPHTEHRENAVPFKEAKDSRQLGIIANIFGALLIILCAIPVFSRCREYFEFWQLLIASAASMLVLFPHEFLHAICFKEDVYLYMNLKQGLAFVVGPEDMSKGRFIFMSLLPNIIFGFIPYAAGLIFPQLIILAMLGALCIGMGFGDYYNVFNAATQMPRGARTYLHKFNSFWYIP